MGYRRRLTTAIAAAAATAVVAPAGCHAFTPAPKSPLFVASQNQHKIRGGAIARHAAAGAADDESEEEQVQNLKGKLTKEFLTIGAPAFVQLAAEPLASLVDTAYLGRLGPEVLGGAGVAHEPLLLEDLQYSPGHLARATDET